MRSVRGPAVERVPAPRAQGTGGRAPRIGGVFTCEDAPSFGNPARDGSVRSFEPNPRRTTYPGPEGLGRLNPADERGRALSSEDAHQVPEAGTPPRPPPAAPGGLSSPEVGERRAREGFNEIPERKVSLWRRLASYLWGPIPWMIEVAAVLAAVLQNWDDFAIILALLLVNAAVGFWEEYQSGNAVAALKAHLAPQARVLRDGVWAAVPARELVPGDTIRVRLGDIVPADVLLLADASLELDQSALTGESLPVTRGAGESAMSGSIVRRGEGTATVTAIGPKTFLGRTAQLVAKAQPVSHLQLAILRIGDTLIALALGLAVVIEAVSLVRGVNLLTSVQFALVLAVAAIPVAMPTVLSVTMAVGARTLAGQKAIVTRLESMEELAGIDVLCSDKTGTLTQNLLTMGDPVAFEGATAREVFEAAVLASRGEDHDPIDDAILTKPGAATFARQFRVTRFVPFDPVLKRTEAVLTGPDGTSLRVTKGAPQAILEVTGGAPKVRAALESTISEIAQRGYRALGVARARDQGAWEYLGVIPLFDPLRPDSAEVLASIRELGVQVKMVTGDQAAIARETGHQLGVEGAVTTPGEWSQAGGAAKPGQIFEEAGVFAQVFPEHKYEIVEQLQQHGHIVGMTGDGVNDAPALKKADVGIAVSGATDAARSAAAVVLTAPGLGVILTAIQQARQTFARMTSYAIYRIEETIRLLLFITLAIVILGFFPVSALEIVLIALLNDGAILAIAYDRTPLSPKPVSWRMGRILRVSSVLGVTGVASTFLLLAIAIGGLHIAGGSLQTLVYLKLSVAGHFVIFLTRTEGPFWKSRPANLLLGSVIGTQVLASTLALMGWLIPRVPPLWVAGIWGYAVLEILVVDWAKIWTYRWADRSEAAKDRKDARERLLARLPWRWFFRPHHRRLAE
jgi:H+-transporting ATPase